MAAVAHHAVRHYFTRDTPLYPQPVHEALAVVRIALTAADWCAHGETFARGHAHLAGRFLEGEELARAIDAARCDEEWEACIRALNGCFAVITRRPRRVSVAVDRLRSMPLFYGRDDDVFVSDNASSIRDSLPSRAVDPIAEAEFCLTGYVTGGETLCSSVRQLEAGTLLHIGSDRAAPITVRRYHAFRHRDVTDAPVEVLLDRMEQVHASLFRRLVDGIGDRPIALPLSGGFDSRLIGVSLRDLGVRDVTCYTYGRPENWETRISRELAQYLGFRWEFVEYSAERWRAWATTPEFKRYFQESGNLTSVPHIQDWPAVRELLREGRIHRDAVFVPGHSGDFLAGSHIPRSFAARTSVRREEVLDALFASHYSLWDWPAGREKELRARFERRIEAVTSQLRDGTTEEAADAFEYWDLQERQAKFIVNSMRVYESFGCTWRLPLFDHELMDFWATIPWHLRIGRSLYFEFARQRQALPITAANTDRRLLGRTLVQCMDAAGLRPAAIGLRRAARRLRWQREYAGSPLAWLALVERERFRRTYTGKELMHSYLALMYRDLASQIGPHDALA